MGKHKPDVSSVSVVTRTVWDDTQQNSYSISHSQETVTTQWLDSDSVVAVDNW